MASHPVLICTHCGGDLQKDFEKQGSKTSIISCTKCGNTKDVIEAMSENQKHESYHLSGNNPVVYRF